MHNIVIPSLISNIMFGAVALAFIYHIVLYVFNKDKLLIHYLLYLFFTGIYDLMLGGYLFYFFGEKVENFYYNNLNESTQILYLAFYFNFILQSVEVDKIKSTFLYRSWIAIMSILLGYATIIFIVQYSDIVDKITIPFIAIRVFIFVLTFIMLIRCYKLRYLTFQRYILYGCSIYFVFGVISFISNMNLHEEMAIWPPEWLILGSFVDIVFFSIAMSYRNKKQWETMNLTLLNDANEIIAMQKIVLEKQAALENERTRIAADMHDDLGSGLTRITYLSQMALANPDNRDNLLNINKTSSDLIENMSEIIWAMKEENNSIEDLITYIKLYSVEYLESNAINLEITIPENYTNIVINGDYRRNIFLSVKEALHNVVKHSKASIVKIEISLKTNLKITIIDNGIGFDCKSEKTKKGNGLQNMTKRIENINGSIECISDNGTKLLFTIPIDKLNY